MWEKTTTQLCSADLKIPPVANARKRHIAVVCRSGQTNPNSGQRRLQTKQTNRTQYAGCNPRSEKE